MTLRNRCSSPLRQRNALFPLLTLQNGIGRIRAELAWMQATLDKLQKR